MSYTLIKNAKVINEGEVYSSDVLIKEDIIFKVAENIKLHNDFKIVDASNKILIPGVIDDQVHFREPGLTHKATISSESKAAIAGGITSFIEMPNTIPQTTTLLELDKKFDLAKKNSFANYSFMFGGTNDNLEEIKKIDEKNVAALKLFLGSSTGNMLVDDEKILKKIFENTNLLIAVHSEDEKIIKDNFKFYKSKYGKEIPVELHPKIRSREACLKSTVKVIKLAKETNARLHVFHLSTKNETLLFDNHIKLKDKKITAEVCVHHLWFTDKDYKIKKSLIKWNPAIKSYEDREALWSALNDDRIDVIATDHAPHTKEEKLNKYPECPSGGPLVQHGLVSMIQHYLNGKITLEKIVSKMCHNPAILFQIEKRGFIREGYFADLVLLDLNKSFKVNKKNILYKCGWSPFEGTTFNSSVSHTFLNGVLVYENGIINKKPNGRRLTFER